MTNVMDHSGRHIAIDGHIVEVDALNIVERLMEINENLVVLANVSEHHIAEEPYVIAELCADGRFRKVFGVWELDERVITRVQLADSYGRDILADIDRENEKVQENKQNQFKEKLAEANEIAWSVLDTHKSVYTAPDINTGEKITFYDDRPAERG